MGLFDDFSVDTTGGTEEKRGLDRIPEGDYEVTIVESEIDESKKRVGFNLHFPHIGGRQGTKRWKSHSVRTQKAFDFLVKELKKIGLEPRTKDDVIKLVNQSRGMIVSVQVKNQSDSDVYQNFYFNKALGRDRLVTDVHQVFGGSHDDGLPFP